MKPALIYARHSYKRAKKLDDVQDQKPMDFNGEGGPRLFERPEDKAQDAS